MNLLKEENFRTRAITGTLFVGVIIALIFIHEYTFFALTLLISFFCLREFYNLTIEKDHNFFKAYILVVGLIFIILFTELTTTLFGVLITRIIILEFILLFSIVFLQLIYASEKPFINLAFAYFGLLYISVPMISMFHIAVDLKTGFKPTLALLLFVLVWINDTGAYITGKLFGKTKLFERISFKKTWEGTIGGVLFCMILGAVYGKFVLDQSWIIYAGLGLVIGVFSTLGDLIESQLKRSLNIKDSGTMLPGHGGFLDRFDGFLMAMPAAYFYLLLVR